MCVQLFPKCLICAVAVLAFAGSPVRPAEVVTVERVHNVPLFRLINDPKGYEGAVVRVSVVIVRRGSEPRVFGAMADNGLWADDTAVMMELNIEQYRGNVSLLEPSKKIKFVTGRIAVVPYEENPSIVRVSMKVYSVL